jgi:hypothetical protein
MAAESDSGHFRITFLGYRQGYGSGPTRPDPEPGDPAPAWDTASDEDEMAYFQAEISWINLGGGDAPHAAALSAMITGDVRGLRDRAGAEDPPSSPAAGAKPLSLGTYALSAGKNAVAIGNPAVQAALPSRADVSPVPGREPFAAVARRAAERSAASAPARAGAACRLDLPISEPVRGRQLFLTYEIAQRLARTDSGLGRGVFCMRYRDGEDSGRESILQFRIERLG